VKAQPLVSIILPTRGRARQLRLSLGSLADTALDPDTFQVELAIDDDDLETLADLRRDPLSNAEMHISQRFGYRWLHRYVNELCSHARGDWLFLWNDDALMTTEGWDVIIRDVGSSFLLINPDSNHGNHALGSCVFPIIPRRWFEATGHFSLSNHNDTWVEVVAKQLGIVHNVPIHIYHDRVDLTGGNDDQTARERDFTTGEFFGSEVQAAIRRDVDVLRCRIPELSTEVLEQ
jgi:hypothetical protein